MYNSFHVKNFRCFKDLQINDLDRVNLIAGKNNTGKTALMEAIYLHTRPQNVDELQHLQEARGLGIPNQDLSDYWKHYFYNLDSSQDIKIDGENNQNNHSLTIFEAFRTPDYVHHFDHCAYILMNQGESEAEAFRLAKLVNAAIVMDYEPRHGEGRRGFSYLYSNGTLYFSKVLGILSKFIAVQGRPSKNTTVKQFSKIVREGRLSTIVETLNALDPGLSDIRLLKEYGEELIWSEVNSRYLPIKLMGEGINRVLHFLLTLISYPNGYLFIDEIENGIHYTAQKDVWKAIGQVARELDIQVFATTHSLEMIRAAYEAFSEDKKLDEFRFHRLDRDRETGDIEAVTYNEPALHAIASFDFDFEVRG